MVTELKVLTRVTVEPLGFRPADPAKCSRTICLISALL